MPILALSAILNFTLLHSPVDLSLVLGSMLIHHFTPSPQSDVKFNSKPPISIPSSFDQIIFDDFPPII